MFHKKWDEKMNEKKWDEMQKYKEFNKDNCQGIERFSRIFNKFFSLFRYSFLLICIIAIIIGLLIYFGVVSNLANNYL